jgi:hypothetical protein
MRLQGLTVVDGLLGVTASHSLGEESKLSTALGVCTISPWTVWGRLNDITQEVFDETKLLIRIYARTLDCH